MDTSHHSASNVATPIAVISLFVISSVVLIFSPPALTSTAATHTAPHVPHVIAPTVAISSLESSSIVPFPSPKASDAIATTPATPATTSVNSAPILSSLQDSIAHISIQAITIGLHIPNVHPMLIRSKNRLVPSAFASIAPKSLEFCELRSHKDVMQCPQ
ncbi:hypothetical protein U1Q18_002586 [Sarracenia purpurea var. burkii]